MEVKVRKNDNGVYLVELGGLLDLFSSEQLKELVLKIIEKRAESLIISLKDIDRVDSVGIGALIFISSTLKKLSCPLIFVVPEGPVMTALEVTKLKSYFTIAPTLKEAITLAAGLPPRP